MDWESAQRVAENHDPDSVIDVLSAMARAAFKDDECAKGESLYLRAEKPELAIGMYRVSKYFFKCLLKFRK